MTVSGPMPKQGGGAVRAWTIAVSVVYSLMLAVGGGYVFYASIRPVSIQTGYFSECLNGPWEVASVLLFAVWVVGPVMLLTLGIDLCLHNRSTWWFAVGWLSALAGGTAIGLLIRHDFGHLFTAYPRDLDGSPLGPSRFDPGSPYWQAFIAAGGELAMGFIMIALVAALSRKDESEVLARPRHPSQRLMNR
jgi:hypothetical protein